MAGGHGTHATRNRLDMEAAVEGALREALPAATLELGIVAEIRADFLAELRERAHVVGHVTDRHHELLAACAELLARLESPLAPAGQCLGCWVLAPDHEPECPLESIRLIVANPLRGAT